MMITSQNLAMNTLFWICETNIVLHGLILCAFYHTMNLLDLIKNVYNLRLCF